MSIHETATGQKTPNRQPFARRRLGAPAARPSAPPHNERASFRSVPQHPLPTRRAGGASSIVRTVSDALIGTDPWGRASLETLRARCADIDWFGVAATATVLFNLLAIVVIAGGGQ